MLNEDKSEDHKAMIEKADIGKPTKKPKEIDSKQESQKEPKPGAELETSKPGTMHARKGKKKKKPAPVQAVAEST